MVRILLYYLLCILLLHNNSDDQNKKINTNYNTLKVDEYLGSRSEASRVIHNSMHLLCSFLHRIFMYLSKLLN